MKYLFLLLLTMLSWSSVAYGKTLIDLQQNIDSFILEEKQIFIEGYPDAFNPSLVRWYDGRLLLSFRARDPLTHSTHLMGFVWLNENFETLGPPTLLTIYGGFHLNSSRAQDPRIVRIGSEYYIAYNNILTNEDRETRRMLVTRLHHEEDQFFIIHPQYLLNFVGDKKNWIEKNWAPFDYNGNLFFSYSLNPHRVFLPLLPGDACETIAVTSAEMDWKWGELRGGTPSLLFEDHYLGFFHSFVGMKSVQSKGKKMAHYFMGAYLFNTEAPFALTHMSSKPIIGSTFYSSPEYPTWKPLRVVFPGGFVYDENYVWVVYGRQDFESWVVKLDKKGLMNSLVSVKKAEPTIETSK